MKKLLICILFLTSCSSINPGEEYVKTNFDNCNTVIPLMIKYTNNDPKLAPIEKKIRIKSMNNWWNLNKERWGEINGK